LTHAGYVTSLIGCSTGQERLAVLPARKALAVAEKNGLFVSQRAPWLAGRQIWTLPGQTIGDLLAGIESNPTLARVFSHLPKGHAALQTDIGVALGRRPGGARVLLHHLLDMGLAKRTSAIVPSGGLGALWERTDAAPDSGPNALPPPTKRGRHPLLSALLTTLRDKHGFISDAARKNYRVLWQLWTDDLGHETRASGAAPEAESATIRLLGAPPDRIRPRVLCVSVRRPRPLSRNRVVGRIDLEVLQDVGRMDVERAREIDDDGKRRVAPPALDAAEVCVIDARAMRELLEREAAPRPQPS
jgi:hypothetical protein